MPGRNGSGPTGMGPMTGRGLGLCSGNPQPYYGCRSGMGYGRGQGFARGCGFGGGRFRGRFPNAGYPAGPYYGQPPYPAAAQDPQAEQAYLEGEASTMQTALDQIKKRLDELRNEQA